MAMFYFDTHAGHHVKDEIGIDCDGAESVRQLARESLAGLVQEAVRASSPQVAITVRDDRHRPFLEMSLKLQERSFQT